LKLDNEIRYYQEDVEYVADAFGVSEEEEEAA